MVEGGREKWIEEREQGGGRVAVALRDDEGALGAGWFPGSMCVPPPSLHSAPPCTLLPIHRLWPPLGVVIQISKSVCFHPPPSLEPPFPPHPLFTLRSPLRPPFAGHLSHQLPSFHGNLEAGLCILYSVCDKPTRYVCSCRCGLPTSARSRPNVCIRLCTCAWALV